VVRDLANCLCAVELHRSSYDETRNLVGAALRAKGLTMREATALCDHWFVQDDFLLTPLEGTFTHVIGNPPYVRQEMIPDALMAEYRRRYATIYDRADIYVPFIERSLSLLAPGGALGFICADRWMKNRYGGPLRRFVAENFHLRHFVDMVDTDAFLSDVIAYPAIIVIGREKSGPTRVAHQPAIGSAELSRLAKAMTARKLAKGRGVSEFADVVTGAEPWMLHASDHLDVVRRIEADCPTLEEAGCKVGIGVATGADQVFIGPFDKLDVEPDRKLPLVTRAAWCCDQGSPCVEEESDWLVSDHRSHLPRADESAEAADPGYQGRRAYRLRAGQSLPAPQSVFHHLGGLESAGAASGADVRRDPRFHRPLLDQNARRLSAFPGAISAPAARAALAGRSGNASQRAGSGGGSTRLYCL
jgi:hypothetical protein